MVRYIKISILLIVCSVPLVFITDSYIKDRNSRLTTDKNIDLFESDHSMYFPGRLLTADNKTTGHLERSKWVPVSKFNLGELRKKDEIWYRIPFDIHKIDKPALLIIPTHLLGIEVYLDHKCIFQYGSFRTTLKEEIYHVNYSPLILTLPVDLHPPPSPQQILYVRKHYNQNLIKATLVKASLGHIYAGHIDEMVSLAAVQYFRFGFWESSMGIVFLFLGCISIGIFIAQGKERDYVFVYFGFFLLCAGIHYLEWRFAYAFNLSYATGAYLIQLSNTLLPAGIVALIGQLVDIRYRRLFTRLGIFHIVFVLFFLSYTMLFPSHLKIASFIFNALVLAYLVTGLIVLHKSRSQLSSKILIAAFILFCFTAVIDLLRWTIWMNFFRTFPDKNFYGIGVLFLVLAFGYVIFDHYRKTMAKAKDYALELEFNKRKLLQLKSDNLQARFDVLKSQLNPHFLFNTFGALISLIRKNGKEAVHFVEELSRVYRHLLQTQHRKIVTVRSELEFIDSYAYLVKQRFGKKVEISIEVADRYMDYFVPPLSLQLLVENAIKHNVISKKSPLKITLTVQGGDYLVVQNNYQKKALLEKPTMVGLANLKQRYHLFTRRSVYINSNDESFRVKIPILTPSLQKSEGAKAKAERVPP